MPVNSGIFFWKNMDSKYCFIKDIILEILKRNFINPKKENINLVTISSEQGYKLKFNYKEEKYEKYFIFYFSTKIPNINSLFKVKSDIEIIYFENYPFSKIEKFFINFLTKYKNSHNLKLELTSNHELKEKILQTTNVEEKIILSLKNYFFERVNLKINRKNNFFKEFNFKYKDVFIELDFENTFDVLFEGTEINYIFCQLINYIFNSSYYQKDNFEYSFLIEENGFIVNEEKFVHFLNQLRFEVNYYAIFEEINKKIIFLKENNINHLFLNKRIK